MEGLTVKNTTAVCFKCKREKCLSEFYKHPQMANGHLGKCKDCTRKDAKERRDRLCLDSKWVEKERKRCRAKEAKYLSEFPEKSKAHNAVKRSDGANCQHHWSYRPEHRRDVIEVSVPVHFAIHRFMIYDRERFMYRTLDGVLLDTREASEAYYASILKREGLTA